MITLFKQTVNSLFQGAKAEEASYVPKYRAYVSVQLDYMKQHSISKIPQSVESPNLYSCTDTLANH